MWFAARLILKSEHIGTPDPPIFQDMSAEELDEETYEELIVLIQADDETAAHIASEAVGKSKEHSYENRYGQTVSWSLVKMAEIKEIIDGQIGHGTEVFYRFFGRRKGDTSPIE